MTVSAGLADLRDLEDPDGTGRTLREFTEALADVGYVDLCAGFHPLFPRPGRWGELAEGSRLPRALRAVARLFLLGVPVPRAELTWERRAGEGLDLLLRLGLLQQDGTDVVSRARLLLHGLLGTLGQISCHGLLPLRNVDGCRLVLPVQLGGFGLQAVAVNGLDLVQPLRCGGVLVAECLLRELATAQRHELAAIGVGQDVGAAHHGP